MGFSLAGGYIIELLKWRIGGFSTLVARRWSSALNSLKRELQRRVTR